MADDVSGGVAGRCKLVPRTVTVPRRGSPPGVAKLLALLASLLVLAPLAAARPTAAGRELAFVSAEDDDLLVAVDLERRAVVARIRVADGPHNVAAASHLPVALVTSPPAGVVTLVSTRTLRVLKVFRGLASPHDIEIAGRYALVTEEEGGRVAMIDLSRRRLVARVRVGRGPHDLAIGQPFAWVTHGRGDRSLTILNGVGSPGALRVAGRVAAGGAAHDISHQPDSANVFVTYWNSTAVAGIDVGRRGIVFRKRLGTLLHHVQFDYFSGRHVWVTDHGGGRAFLVSTRTGRVERTVTDCPGAHHVALFPRSRRAAIACHDSGRLLLVDPASARRSSIEVGRGLHGVATAYVP
jgi:DNA-binding beta-propeller fold protein YncE